MRTVISVAGTFHAALLANSILLNGSAVEIYSSAPRKFYRGLDGSVRIHLVPAPLQIAGHFMKRAIPQRFESFSTGFFDLAVSAVMGRPDLFIGWATQALFAARQAQKCGGVFVLDRACPHRDFQESLVECESERLGVSYTRQPRWFRDRQLEEYELAEAILVPSEYTARTFPEHLQYKLVKAPLLGRCREPKNVRTGDQPIFTVGVVGGSPIRKGYLYLLKAWKKLALPNAKLLLRAGNLMDFPALRELLSGMTNVEFVGYVEDISEFYQRCDVFVLPSVDDGFGMALIEAMLNGRACVTTSNTGASELMTNGRDGIVVSARDEDQLASAILRLYENKDLRAEMGAVAENRAKQIAASGLYERAIRSLLESLPRPGSAVPESEPVIGV